MVCWWDNSPAIAWMVPLMCPRRPCRHPAAVLGAESLIAGVGKDYDCGPVGQELDQPY